MMAKLVQEYLLVDGVLRPARGRPEQPPVGPAHPEQRGHHEPALADPERRPRGTLGERYVFHE